LFGCDGRGREVTVEAGDDGVVGGEMEVVVDELSSG
jgi:hypothetical protein